MRQSGAIVAAVLIILTLALPQGQAATIVDFISFPPLTSATDSTSGNLHDFIYQHTLVFPQPDAQLVSATISLIHSGNLDSGPTSEIWVLETWNDEWIGKLSKSEPSAMEDQFTLSDAILSRYFSSGPWNLKLALSEQTPYNGEKIQLYQSTLTAEYQLPGKTHAATVPEPGTGLLITGGLVLYWGRKKRENKKRRDYFPPKQ